jgi:thiamine-monophosphate kinase
LTSNPPRAHRAPDRGEFLWIRTFVAPFHAPAAPFGPGDDAAVVRLPGRALCVTTDALVEGVHFSRSFSTLADVGYKALAVNLSDLAAMGATPDWFVCSLAMPRRFSRSEVKDIAAGMSLAARRYQIRLIGGNFSAARELSVTITAAGTVRHRNWMTRQGARAGDWLYVSGELGEARLGLELLRKGRRGPSTRRHLRPTPRVRLGSVASAFARAAIDVSDGFAQDLSHLCDASSVGAEVDLDRLPIGRSLKKALPPRKQIEFALAGGEDYELIFAVPSRRGAAFERACAQIGERVTRVGAFVRGSSVHLLQGGTSIPVPLGFDHFR